MAEVQPTIGQTWRVVNPRDEYYREIGVIVSFIHFLHFPVELRFKNGRRRSYQLSELEWIEPAPTNS